MWFVLNCVFVHEADWLDTLNSLVELRRHLRDTYHILPREELKGSHFRNGKGAFDGLNIGRRDRMDIYREIMNYQSSLPIKTFAVAINKEPAAKRGWDIRHCAWTFALQRLDRNARQEADWCSVYPDEGHGFFIRQRIRSMRRYNHIPSHYGPGSIRMPTERILEDPNDRRSQDSYFVQLADLNAFAAHRSAHIHPRSKMDRDVWDALQTAFGDARHLKVNSLKGGPPGIVVYP